MSALPSSYIDWPWRWSGPRTEDANRLMAFRKTDLVMRDGTDFWILVPYTDPITVTDKVTTLLEVTAQNGLAIVDRDVALFTLDMPLMAAAPKSAVPQFLDYLKRHRQVAIGWQRPAQTS